MIIQCQMHEYKSIFLEYICLLTLYPSIEFLYVFYTFRVYEFCFGTMDVGKTGVSHSILHGCCMYIFTTRGFQR